MGFKKYSWVVSLIAAVAIIVVLFNFNKIIGVELPELQAAGSVYGLGEEAVLLDIPFENNPEGILLEEYSDFECPYCARAHPYLLQILAKYNGKLNYQFYHLLVHESALTAAEASECARDQDKFLEYATWLFGRSHSKSKLKQYAQNLNLDMEKFNTCLNSGEKKEIIITDTSDALMRGVKGTPTFVLEGEKVYIDQLDMLLQNLVKIKGDQD